MKKGISVLVVMMFALTFATVVYADPVEKLKGGAEKFVKSPKQVCDHVKAEYEAAEFKPFGVVGGFMKGLFYTGWDAGTGLIDILTFPVDFNGGE